MLTNPISRLQSTPSSATKPKPSDTSRITKFTKKLSEDDKRKQFAKEKKATASPAPSPSSSSSKSRKSKNAAPAAAASPSTAADAKPVVAKKRVQLLMSVPRGQNINQTTKSNLISQFLAKTAGSTSSDSSRNKSNNPEPMEVDPPAVVSGGDEVVIVLDD